MIKLLLKISVLLCFTCVAFLSCEKENAQETESHNSFNYFPLTAGSQRVYKVTYIQIDKPIDINDTTIYFMRETVKDTLIAETDYTLYIITHERRMSDTLPWELYKQSMVRTYKHSIATVQDNVPYLVLSFPEKVGKTWDGNMFNSLEAEEYEITDIAYSNNLADMLYDSVLTIQHNYLKTLYTYTHKEERYAYNIGMVYKTIINVESQPIHGTINLNDPIEQRITYGTLETYELLDFNIVK